MFSTLVALAVAHPVTFPGGTVTNLVASIAEATKAPVLAAVLDNRRISKFEYDTSNLTEMARTIYANAGLRQAPGVDYAYHPDSISPALVQIEPVRGRGGQPPFRYVTPPRDAMKEGVVTWTTGGGEAFRLEDIDNAFSKPIVYHWTQEPYAMVARVNGVQEGDFVRLVAKAVGAKLVSTKEQYRLEFDPNEFRRRARNTLRAVTPDRLRAMRPVARATYELCLAALDLATPQQIAQAFFERGGQTLIPLGAGQMGLAQARLQAELEEVAQRERAQEERDERGDRRGGGPGRALRMMSNVDLRHGAAIVLHSDFRTQVECVTVDGLGRPAGRVRF